MVAHLSVMNGRGSHGGCNPNARCGNGLEKIYPTCAVRYGYMGYLGEFRYSPGVLFGCGAKVVVQTNRGIEIGKQVSLTCSGCERSISRQQIVRYVNNSGPEFYRLKTGRILRPATEHDLLEEAMLNQQAARELIRGREMVRERGMQMKLVACEHLFGGERVVFYFMAEGRIDFRDLVRDFAREFNTRIEMHQVGARDEARLVADYEICGRECCCKNFLKKLRPVTMRMAKLQKATLDPSKVSGRCGRLRCCLRYEHEGYEALDKKLPRTGHRIRTAEGIGTVVDRQVLTQLLQVRYDSGKMGAIAIEEVVERDLPRLAPDQPAASGPGGSRQDPRRSGERNDRSGPSGGRSGDRVRGSRDAPSPAKEPPSEVDREADAEGDQVSDNGEQAFDGIRQQESGYAGATSEGSESRPAGAAGQGPGREGGGMRRRGRRGRRRRRHHGGPGGPGGAPPEGGSGPASET